MSIPQAGQKKNEAETSIEQALKTKGEAAIDSLTDLTDEEKAVAKADAKGES